LANILMGWEMGAGHGHVVPLLALARRLREHGHRPIIALRDVVTAAAHLRKDGFTATQAPVWRPPAEPALRLGQAASFADVLVSTGFGTPDKIHAVLSAWDGLIDLAEPKLVVAEYSVGLGLAARGRVPVVAMGTGFSMPPPHLEAFPVLRPKVKPLIRQGDLLSHINAVQRERGAPPLSRLPALFDAEGQFVYVLPLMDPYADCRIQPADGPLEPLPDPVPPAKEHHVFVYMGMEHTDHGALLEGLGRAGLPATVYLRGASPEYLRKLERPGLHMLDAPMPFSDILPKCTLVVHYGALGTAAACLGMGRPQVVLPRYLERSLLAEALAKHGTGIIVPKDSSASDMASLLRGAADNREMAEKAQAIAADIKQAPHNDVLSRIVERCLSLIDRT
jgi:hypothetical protein